MKIILGFCLFTLLISSASAEEALWAYKKKDKKQTEIYVKTLSLPIEEKPQPEPRKQVTETVAPDYISLPVPKVTLRKGMVISEDHLDFTELLPHKVSQQFASDPMQILGQQVRRTLYKGRPIRIEDTGPIILVKRNQDVDLLFSKNGIILKTHGRALSDAGTGERIKAMNLTSKQIVFGKVTESGAIDVSL